jgi:hypothetical protein
MSDCSPWLRRAHKFVRDQAKEAELESFLGTSTDRVTESPIDNATDLGTRLSHTSWRDQRLHGSLTRVR